MKREHGAVFRQSLNFFPCPVSLGKDTPFFGLHRYKQGLRFFPTDDEGFTIRGDNKQLLYNGRRRSHRFTILDNSAFEYDCILLKEPESNVISLRMEGSENFDFFKQPDFVKEPFLRGSYAVYKKETFIGEGTGKLCHIHRPEIIDARGRRCWGELNVFRNILKITIPEWWLSEAKYPVIVDPIIGTNTIGSLKNWLTYDEKGVGFYTIYKSLAVNKYLVNETFNGTLDAYVYTSDRGSSGSCLPIIYSDNNDLPNNKISNNENSFDVTVNSYQSNIGWRSTTFNANIQNGSYIWFGVDASCFYPRFDYGAILYWYSYRDDQPIIKNPFPFYSDKRNYDIKMSMYFSYNMSQNYVCRLTQGINFSDEINLSGNYYRKNTQTVGLNSMLKGLLTFYRKCVMTVLNTINLKRFYVFKRKLSVIAGNTAEIKHKEDYYRKNKDIAKASGILLRRFFITIKILTFSTIRDYIIKKILAAKEELIIKSCITKEITLESKII